MRRITFPLVLLLSCVTGCGILPSRKTESQSLRSAEALQASNAQVARRVVSGSPAPQAPSLRVGGLWNRVELQPGPVVTPPSAIVPGGTYALSLAPAVTNLPPYYEEVTYQGTGKTDAQATEAAKGRYSISLPLGVSIGLVGVGLMALVWGVRAARSSSAAANAAFEAADGAVAGVIRQIRSTATASTDPGEIARLTSQIAALEAERGRMAR